MLIAHLGEERIDAEQAKRDDAFCCPVCREAVILRRGRKVVAQFAHRPRVRYIARTGETRAHLEAKRVLLEPRGPNWPRRSSGSVSSARKTSSCAQRWGSPPAPWPASGGGDGRDGLSRHRPALRRGAGLQGLGGAALLLLPGPKGGTPSGPFATQAPARTEARGVGCRAAGGDPGRPRPLALVGRGVRRTRRASGGRPSRRTQGLGAAARARRPARCAKARAAADA